MTGGDSMNLKPDVTDLDFVARTVMAEAEGEIYEGKVAVAAVIFNRARHPRWWGRTIKDACLTAKQFSAWNDRNSRRNLIGEWDLSDKMFRECFRATVEALDYDPTEGADHYHVRNMENPPAWSKDREGLVIGAHVFFTLREDST